MRLSDAEQYLFEQLAPCCRSTQQALNLAALHASEYIEDIRQDIDTAFVKFRYLHEKASQVLEDLNAFSKLASQHQIEVPWNVFSESFEKLQRITKAIQAHERSLFRDAGLRAPSTFLDSNTFLANNDIVRAIMADLAAVRVRFEWRAPAILMSRYGSAFNPSNIQASSHNYQRSGYPFLIELENRLASEWYPTKGYRLRSLLVNSGMAAYTVIEDYLTKRRLETGDVILTAPYIYFENMEQLQCLKHLRLVQSPSYDAAGIAQLAHRHQAKVVFLDMMANITELSMVDVREFFVRVRDLSIQELTVIIDNTLTPTLNLFSIWEEVFANAPDLGCDLIVLESCNKYRQHGLDVCMAGLITTIDNSASKIQGLLDSRRHTGGVLNDYAAHVFPVLPAELLTRRMTRTDRNCRVFAQVLNGMFEDRIDNVAQHPGLISYQHYESFSAYGVPTGLVTFPCTVSNSDSTAWCTKVIQGAIAQAHAHRASLTNGLSFGFSGTRLSLAARPAVEAPSFLRLAAGTENILNTLKLACIMHEALTDHASLPDSPLSLPPQGREERRLADAA